MSIDAVITAIVGLGIADIVQVLAIIFTLLYLVFAFIILRQVQLMTRTLPSPISPIVIFISILHIGLTIAILILFIGVL